jgi:hypothetical protein
MLVRRLLLLAAVLLLLAAVAAGIAPEPETTEAPVTPPAARSVEVVEGLLSAAEDDQSVRARVGDLIRFEVTGDVLDSVEVERLERIDAIAPGTPARFEILADAAGVYPIRLVEADRRIGRLDIRP